MSQVPDAPADAVTRDASLAGLIATPNRLIVRLRKFAVALLGLNLVSLVFKGPTFGLLLAALLWSWVAKGVTIGRKRAITVLRVWSCCGMVGGVLASLVFLVLIFPFIGCACSSSCVELVYNEAQERRLWVLNHTGELEDWTRNATGKSVNDFVPRGRALSFVGTHALSWAAPLLHAADTWSSPPPPSFDQQLAEDVEDAEAEAFAASRGEEGSGGEWETEEESRESEGGSSTTVVYRGRGSTRTIFLLTWAPPPSPEGPGGEGGECPFHREHTHPLGPSLRSHWNGAPHWHHASTHDHAPLTVRRPGGLLSLFGPPPPPPPPPASGPLFDALFGPPPPAPDQLESSLQEEVEEAEAARPPPHSLRRRRPFFSLGFAPRPATSAEEAEESGNLPPALHAALLARFGRGRRLLSVSRSTKGEEGMAVTPEEQARKDAFADKHRPRPQRKGEGEEEGGGGEFKRSDPAVALAIRFVEGLGNVTLATVQRKADRVCTVGGPLSGFGFVLTLAMLAVYRMGYVASTRLAKHPWVAQQTRLRAAWQGAKAAAAAAGAQPPPPPPGLVLPGRPTTLVQRLIGVYPPPPPVSSPSGGGGGGAQEVLYRFVPGAGFVVVGGQEGGAPASPSAAPQPSAVVVSPPPQQQGGYPGYPYAAYAAQGAPQAQAPRREEEDGGSWDLGLGSMARSVRTAFARVPVPAFPTSRGSYAPVSGREEGGAGYEMQGLVGGHTPRQPSRGAEPAMHAPSAPPAPTYAPGSAAAYGGY